MCVLWMNGLGPLRTHQRARISLAAKHARSSSLRVRAVCAVLWLVLVRLSCVHLLSRHVLASCGVTAAAGAY